MEQTIPTTALILVAVLPHPRDREIARLLGWYRIPLRRAPKVVCVDYLAFYQTASFGEDERWQIRYAAEVRGQELTTRGELLRDELEHPRAKEEYYKLQIGPLFPLARPIPADRWRRLTFLYTTGDYLNRANTLNDLVVHSEERSQLWTSLRERAAQSGYAVAGQEPTMEVDPAILQWLSLAGFASGGDPDVD